MISIDHTESQFLFFQYRHFDHNSSSDVYYLDLRDTLQLSSTLTYPLHYANNIKASQMFQTLMPLLRGVLPTSIFYLDTAKLRLDSTNY